MQHYPLKINIYFSYLHLWFKFFIVPAKRKKLMGRINGFNLLPLDQPLDYEYIAIRLQIFNVKIKYIIVVGKKEYIGQKFLCFTHWKTIIFQDIQSFGKKVHMHHKMLKKVKISFIVLKFLNIQYIAQYVTIFNIVRPLSWASITNGSLHFPELN